MQNIDFNDLHKTQSLKAVTDCIGKALLSGPFQAKVRRLKPYAWSTLGQFPKREYLVKHLLDAAAMSLVYGECGCGKTFTVLDLVIHVASGCDWRKQKTRQKGVVYVAAEAGMGLSTRLEAYGIHHGLKAPPPLHVIPASINLCGTGGDTDELISEISQIDNVGLVIIDTLSRALAGGNENSSEDMGSFILNCDKIREATKVHVMVIHHSGKEASRGARGHSSLRAAVDTEIEVTKDGDIITAEIRKQREGRTGDKFHFTLQTIEVGKDEDGDPVTSCILIPCGEPAKAQKLTGPAKIAFEVLQKLIASKGKKHSHVGGMVVTAVSQDDFRAALKDNGISASNKDAAIKKAIKRAIKALEDAGLSMKDQGFIWIHGQGDK